MPRRCSVCNDLEKKDEAAPRLALELTAEQCLHIEKTQPCRSCSLIVAGIRRFENASWSLEEHVSRIYLYALSSKGDSLTAEVYFHTARPKLILEFYHTEWTPQWSAIRKRTPVTGYPVLTEGLRWAKSTLDRCRDQHASCAATQDVLLPKRTLQMERLHDGTIHVQICEHENETGRYTALSHCWGTDQGCIATFETLEAYKQQVPWSVIPPTFQDAITFTLALGVQHIWIDSLCIMQHNARDWEVESSQMSEIYQNAYVTLAATAASNGEGGCFSVHRQPAKEFRLDVQGSNGFVVVREKIAHWDHGSSKVSARSFPLLTRGWVLQERHLSPRMLHFCAHELVWECFEEFTCECGGVAADSKPLIRLHVAANDAKDAEEAEVSSSRQSGWSTGTDVSTTSHASDLDETNVEISQLPPSYEEIVPEQRPTQVSNPTSDQWLAIVEQYTALGLSNETDRLPALSGLAKLASSSLGTYASGLWVNTIARDLLWRVPILDSSIGRHTTCTGPTWSWASVKGPVAYWKDLEEDDTEVQRLEVERLRRDLREADSWHDRELATRALVWQLEEMDECRKRVPDLQPHCEISLAGQNIFGAVTSGRLTMKGLVRPATLLYVRHRDSSGSNEKVKEDPLQYRLATQVYARSTSDDFEMELPFFADYILCEPSTGKIEERSALTLFRVQQYVCLVLVGGPVEFRRIGIVRQSSGYQSVYGLDWMAGAAERVVTIV